MRLQSRGRPRASPSTLGRIERRTGEAARHFAELHYRTLKTWSRARRVVGKAEHHAKGENLRFVVTSLAARV